MTKIIPYIILIGMLFTIFSCSDEEKFTTDTSALIEFSADTISFDTVFTTIGSSTKSFQVFNNNDKAVKISKIRLASGGNSGFRLNVDGQNGTSFTDVDILKNDSIFVFVEVKVNPQNADSPILINDSLQFFLESGVCQQVILRAYGQDIIIMKGTEITENTTLSSPRPYLIYDSLVVKSNATLNLAPGTTLCFHSGAILGVHGTLNASGTLDRPVTFRGDRTDKMFWYLPYDRIDGQWGGINLYKESADNILNYADIHGGKWGIICDSTGVDTTKLTMLNSSIHNVQSYGLYSYCNKMLIANSQITNAQGGCMSVFGGDYEVYHTTIAQLYPWSAEIGRAVEFENKDGDKYLPLQNLKFANCIITGYNEDELESLNYPNYSGNGSGSDSGSGSGNVDGNAVAFNYEFDNCLVRTNNAGAEEHFKNCVIENKEAATFAESNFRNIDTENYIYDFRLSDNSVARGIGDPAYSALYPTDKKGTIRKTDHPDAGCFEY